MPRYSERLPARVAAYVYRGEPGNYVLWDRRGRAYPGRQSAGVDRLGAHLRRHRGEFVAAQFMRDGVDDPCVRVSREITTINNLIDGGVSLRNKVCPTVPRFCRR